MPSVLTSLSTQGALATVFDGAAWQRCRTHFMRNLPFRLLPSRPHEPVLNALTELEIGPESAGKPLVGRLKGLWSARMGSYRISIQ